MKRTARKFNAHSLQYDRGAFALPGAFTTAGPFVPTDISGCPLWVRSDLGVTQVGGQVSAWADQSGNGNNVTQTIPGAKAILAALELNGYPALMFDGAASYMSFPPVNLGLNHTLFLVANDLNDGGSLDDILGHSTLYNGIGYEGAYVHYSVGTALVGESCTDDVPLSTATYSIMCIKRLNNVVSRYQNGGTAVNTNITQQTEPDFILDQIGKAICFDGAYMYGGFVELILYNSALSDANRLLVENYLNGRYAIY